MEKILNLKGDNSEYEIRLKSTAASLIHYKRQFKRDGLSDMMTLSTIDTDNLEGLDLEVFFNFLWCFAYSADKTIEPIDTWLEKFDIAPLDFVQQSLEVIVELLSSNAQTLKKK